MFAQSVVAAGAFLVLSLLHRNLEPSAASGDWAQYILHAKSLVEGRGYTDTGYLFSQLNWLIGPRAYPPGLPLTLVPIVATGSWAAPLMRLLMIVFGALFVLLAYRRLRLTVHPWIAALAAMWCGVVIELAFASVSVLSDLGFCMLTWLVIWAIDKPGVWSRRRVVLVALTGLMAMSYRVAGIALPAALMVYLTVNRRAATRPVRVVLGVWTAVIAVAIAAAPALLPNRILAPSLDQMINRVTGNLRAIRLTLVDAQAYPSSLNLLNDIYHAVATLFMIVGAIVLVRRGWRDFMVIFAAGYGLMLFVSPVGDTRYYWPLYPLVSVCILQGVATAFGALRRPSQPRGELVAASLAFCLIVLTPAVYRGLRASPAPGFSDYPDAVSLSDYVKIAGERGEIRRMMFTNPRVLTLRTGVPAMGLVTARPSAVLRELERQHVTHVSFGSFTAAGCGAASLQYAKTAYPDAFEHVATFGRFSLERFTPPDSAALSSPRVADENPATLGLCGS